MLSEKVLGLYNNSNSNVYIYLGVASRINGGSIYPDTMLINKNVTIGPISKNSKYYYDFNRSVDTDTLCLFIIDSDTINKYTWEEVRDGYKILQRYDLPFDLKGLKTTQFYSNISSNRGYEGCSYVSTLLDKINNDL